MAKQYGMVIDTTRCMGCQTCAVACKVSNDVPGELYWAHVEGLDGDLYRPTGTFPKVKMNFRPTLCNHCAEPACVANCPTGAMAKREDNGAVVVDQDVCIGCGTCVNSCPYGAPQFIEEDKIVQKCDTCRALREAGHEPVCVEACPMRAIEFGEMDDLRAAHPDAVSELPCTEPAATTTPNILIGASRGALLEDFNPVVL